MSIETFLYEPTAGELAELTEAVRHYTAASAKIDAERIQLTITEAVAVFGFREEPYWRANKADLLVDGKDPDLAFVPGGSEARHIFAYCRGWLIETYRPVDPSRLGRKVT